MKHWTHALASGLTACCLLAHVAGADPTINYQGRITAGGTDFTGQGFFKFVLYDLADDSALWSNDGSPGTNEPATAVELHVNNGLFAVELGDPGMHPLPATAFHAWGPWLRTWFSTNNADFEALQPEVPLRPISFAQIDTRGTLVVDSTGRGDFDDIQSAINHAVSNRYMNRTILLMPGYYALSAPIVLPADDEVHLRGLGLGWDTMLENTNGTAIVAGREAILEDLSILGEPALSDRPLDEWYRLTIRNCRFNGSEGATGAVFVLSADEGSVEVFGSEFGTRENNTAAIRLSGGVRLEASHCEVSAWTGTVDGVVMTAFTGGCRFVDSSIRSDKGRSIVSDGESIGLELADCELDAVVLSHGGGWVSMRDCQVRPWTDGTVALTIDRFDGDVALRNCSLHAVSNRTIQIVGSRLDAAACEISCRADTAVAISSPEDWDESTWYGFRDCRIHVFPDDGQGGAALRIDNMATNSGIFVELIGSDVRSWESNAIECVGAELRVRGCYVEGLLDGIFNQHGDVDVFSSTVEGGGVGIQSVQGETEVSGSSRVFGEAAGVTCTSGMVTSLACDLSGEGGPGLFVTAGGAICIDGTVFSSTESAAVLGDSCPIVFFSGCSILSMATNDAIPVLLIAPEAGSTNVPSPELIGCAVRGLTATRAIDVTGVSSAVVSVVNCAMSANVNPATIFYRAPASSLGNGNFVVPTPDAWDLFVEGDD